MADINNPQTPDPKSIKPAPKKLPANVLSIMKRIKTVQDAADAEFNALGEYATRNTRYNRDLINQQFTRTTAPNTITNTREAIEQKWKDNADKAVALKVVDEYDAINNSLDAYLKQESKFGQNFSTVFNPTTKKFENVDPYSHPAVIAKRKELEYGLKTGQFEIDKDELTGLPILFSLYNAPLTSFSKAIEKSANTTIDTRGFLSLSTEEKVKRIKYENAYGPAYLPQKPEGFSSVTNFIGGVTLPLLKATIFGMGAATIGRLNPALGEAYGAEALANLNKLGNTISWIGDMTEGNQSAAIKKYYNSKLKANPNINPVELMREAEALGGITGAVTGTLEASLMGGAFSKLAPYPGISAAASKINTAPLLESMANSSKKGVLQKGLAPLVPVTKEAAKIGAISATTPVITDVVSNIAGADISAEETMKESIERFKSGAEMVFAFGGLPAAAKSSRVLAETIPFVRDVNAQNIKYALAMVTGAARDIQPSVMHQAKVIAYELPQGEVEALIQEGETQGVYEQGTLKQYKTDKELYDETDAQVPTDIPKEKRDIIRGIQVKINKLTEMAKSLGKVSPLLDRINKMKDQLDEKAVKVLESENPLEVDATYEAKETTAEVPPVAAPEGKPIEAKPIEVKPAETPTEAKPAETTPITEQKKPTENATPSGQEPKKESGATGDIVEPTGTQVIKDQETTQADVGDSNIGGKTKPKVETTKLEVEPEKKTPKEFNNNETATVFGKMKKAAEEYLSKKVDDFSGASRKALATLKNSAFYKGLDKNEREKYVLAATKFFEGKLPPSPSVQRLLGIANDATNVVNNMASLNENMKLQAKAAKDTEMWIKGTRKAISNGLNELKKKGVIKTAQLLSILKKYDSLNLKNNDAINDFTSYVTKIVNDANYNNKLQTASRLNGLINKASKMKGKQVNLISAAKEFLGIDPSKIEDIDGYIERASVVLNGIRSSKTKGLEANFSDAFRSSDIIEYAKEQKAKIEESKKQSKLEDYNELVESGVISKDMSFDEIDQIIGAIEQGKESDIPDIRDKARYVRAYVNKRFDSVSAIVKSMLDRNVDPFTGMQLSDISSADRVRLNTIIGMGLNDLPLKDAYTVVEALNNFAVNGKVSNLDSAIAIGEAYQGGKILESYGIKSLTIKSLFGRKAARWFAADMTSLPVLFDKAFGTNKSLLVQKYMGMSSLMRNKNMAEKIYQEASKEYTDKFVGKYGGVLKSKTNPNGLRFDAKENIYERGMLAFMRRNRGGDEASVAKEFNRRKTLLQETIDALRSRGGDYGKMADLYQTAFDKLVRDSKNSLEVDSKADSVNLEAVNWWTNQWGKHYEKMKDVNLNIYNQDLGFHNNYTQDTYGKFDKSETPTSMDPLSDNPFFSSYDYIPDVKSGTLMKTTDPEMLPNGKFIDLDFDYNSNRALKTALTNIHTAKDLRQVKAFRDSPFFDKIFNQEDGNVFKGKISNYAKRMQNRDIAESREFSNVGRSLSVAATTAVSTALSSFAQPFKQLAPSMHTLIATNGRLAINDALNADAHDFLDRIGYGISNRGMGSQFSMERVSSMLRQADDNALMRGVRALGKIQEAKLKIFVGYSDILTARMAWLSYYKDALRKKGEDVSNLDWKTHEINKDAADYAEQMTNVSQNVSDTDLQGTFIGSQDPYHKAFKNTVMTLANYTMNQKAKVGGNIRVALGKGVAAEDRSLAVKSLAGTAAEMFVYNAIWQMANNIQWGIADKMSNTTPSQEEKRRRELSSKRTTITNLTNDLFSPHPIMNDGLDKLINFGLEKIDPDTPKAFEVRLYDGGGADAWAKNYGVGGILLKNIMDASKYNDIAISGEVKTEDPFGEEQVKKLTGEDKKIAMSWMPLVIAGRTLGFSDMSNVSNKIIKNLSARGMSEENALINKAIDMVPAEEGKATIVDNKTINQAAAEAVKFKDPESRAKYLLDLKKKYGAELWSKEIDLISDPKLGIIDGGTVAFMTAMANNDQDAMKVYRAFSLAKPEAKVESLVRTKQEIGSDRFFKKVRNILDMKMLSDDAIVLFAKKLDKKDLDKFIKIYAEFSKQEQAAADAEEEAKRLEEQRKAASDALGTEQ
jgi:hypothetical protein